MLHPPLARQLARPVQESKADLRLSLVAPISRGVLLGRAYVKALPASVDPYLWDEAGVAGLVMRETRVEVNLLA